MEFTGNHKCEDCGGWFPPEEISYGPDPFRSEIRGDDTPLWQCNECSHNSYMEI